MELFRTITERELCEKPWLLKFLQRECWALAGVSGWKKIVQWNDPTTARIEWRFYR